jgi:carboxylesterase type B
METVSSPHIQDLQFKGFIEGLLIKEKSTRRPICHYFGAVPYALPPTGEYRWRPPRQLEPCYRYGTRASPGKFTGKATSSPQLGKRASPVDENCLECNIWVPAGNAPFGGWPVYFYVHGGFLQVGSPNSGNPVAFLGETDCKCIVVKPVYRLNVFGFLASRELRQDAVETGATTGNYGFWDLRLALEWTYKTISYFAGNPANITIGGYSAGAHACFHQLAYDITLPASNRIIRRLVMHSNGPGLQPKSLEESQLQFDELVSVLNIPSHAPNKVALLREKTPEELLAATLKMKIHQFRAVTDGEFVRKSLFQEIEDGRFARRLRDANVPLLIGECADEHFIYARWKPPENSLSGLFRRLLVDYPQGACAALLRHYFPNRKLPPQWRDWNEAFGHVYADVQIHMSQRGFVDALVRGGAEGLVHRYRIEWRASCTDKLIPKGLGVTHGTDIVLWWWGDGNRLLHQEKEIVKDALLNGLGRFINGEKINWGPSTAKELRKLRSDGGFELCEDILWKEKLDGWKIVQAATLPKGSVRANL